MLKTLDILTSGLVAQRSRLDTIAGNIANVNTTRDEHGELSPFQRRLVTFQAQEDGGVHFKIEVDEKAEPRKAYQPDHPDADEQGNVSYPGINLTTEFVNALEASRVYEAGVSAMELAKSIQAQSSRILS